MPEPLTPASTPAVARHPARVVDVQAGRVHRVALRVFLAMTAVACAVALTAVSIGPAWSWFFGAHLLASVVAVAAGLSRRLPFQNVLACGLALVVTSGMILALIGFWVQDDVRSRLVHAAPHAELRDAVCWWAWPAPLLCTAVLLASRQTAKVLLQPWRRNKQYGWWLLGLASVLAWGVIIVAEPYADRVLDWWSWPDKRPGWWYGMPLPWLAVVFGISAILLLAAGVWLIPKRRTGRPPDFDHVWVWAALLGWVTLGNLRAGLWVAGAVGCVVLGMVVAAAWFTSRMPLNTAASAAPASDG